MAEQEPKGFVSKWLGDLTWTPPAWTASLRERLKARLEKFKADALGPAWKERLRSKVSRAHKDVLALRTKDPRRFWTTAGVAVCVFLLLPLGVRWYWRLPKYVKFSVLGTSPAATRPADVPIPEPVHIDFGGSAARLDKVGKPVPRGITLVPHVPGIWVWASDSRLTFTPKEDWAIGQDYVVRLDRSLFPDHVRLERYDYRFRSAPFTAALSAAEFYQDPTNPKLKKVVATVSFSHPVDPAEFEKLVALRLAGQERGFFGFGAKTYPFTILYNKHKSEAFIHSDPVDIPMNDTYMAVSVDGGLRAARGGRPFGETLERQVPIPGMYNYFRIDSAVLTIVRNERYEPERVLVVQTSAGALESEIRKALSVYVLPQDLPAVQGGTSIRNYRWHDPAKVSPEILALSTPLQLEPLPTDREYSTLHSFRLKAEAGRHLYIHIQKGIQSYGGYVLARKYDQVSRVSEFPQELKIMYDGAVLSLSGERKVSIVSRDIDAVRFEAARVVPNQINHLVSQSGGLFRSPEFKNYEFSPDNIAERFSEVRVLNRLEPGKTQYSSFDLSGYLDAADGTKRGLFFFKVEGWDPIRKQATGIQDRRLLLVTDLGILVKDVQGGGHEVFVQSIHSGSPAGGAQVQILGKNGLPILSAVTDDDGHAGFPPLVGMEREKAPTVYLVRRGGDLSFLPYGWEERRLNLSRFDVGGARTPGAGERLQAYLFSDRGIYRPGDEFHVGLIVKPADWKESLAGVPLEAAITDARGLEVFKRKILLSAQGFEDLRYQTEESAPTGSWQTSVYIVKDGRRAGLLGSTSIRIEEFLPDRLRIATRLSKERTEGWVSPKDIEAFVTLKNLFGTPAADRKVKAMLTLSPSYPAFRSYPDHVFFDPQRAKNSFTEHLQEQRTSGDGEAAFKLDLERFEKATYRLDFTAEGYEADSGRGVASESSVLVSMRDYLVGYKPDGELRYIAKGSARSVELIAVDPELKRKAVQGLAAQLVELRFVSVLVRQANGTYKYESIQKEVPLSKKELALPAQGLRYPLPTSQPGDFALVLRDADDTELCRVPFSVAGSGNLTRSLEKNAELKVQLSKGDYAPSEEIEIQITAPYVGAGLITIERERVFAYKWFKSSTTGSTQRIRIPDDMEGNGYVVVSFLRAMDSPEVFMSPLSYGVAPFTVSRERRTAPVTLECPDLARPGEPYRIRYRSGKPGRIVVFAVDEGILQVAGYKAPDPLSRFFEKRALEVQTSQILDLVLPEFKLIQSLSAPGGDMGREALGRNLNPFKRKRDKPVAFWSGILESDSTEREVVYPVPDYFNGTLRVMAVVVAMDSIGVAQKKALVRGHFVLTPGAPVVAAPGDEFEVSLGVSNTAEGAKEAEVRLELRVSEHLEVLGVPSQNVRLSGGKETSVAFKLRAMDKLGSAALRFTADEGERKSRASVELSVRPPTPYTTTVAGGALKSGKADVLVTRGMYPQYRTLEASASPLPLGLARGLIRYLEKFPHGCTEQIVSQAFPAVILRGRPEFGFTPEKVASNLEQAFRTLRARQNAEGAFGFWGAADSQVSDLQTVYALHFLTEAKDRGAAVPMEVLQRGLSPLAGLVGSEPSSLADARVRAYAAYVLTRNGAVLSAPLLSLQRHMQAKFPKQWKKDLAGIYLAAVYRLLQQNGQANSLISESRLGDPQKVDHAAYYDDLIRESQLLYILARHFPERLKDLGWDDLKRVVDPVVNGSFNTLSSAYTILALDAYAGAVGSPPPADVRVTELRPGSAKPLPLSAGLFPKAEFSGKANAIRFDNAAGRMLFYQVTTAGFDLAPPAGEIKARLEVQREYRNEGGNSAVTKTALGTQLDVHVKVRAVEGGETRDIAIIDLLPGGFEVVLEPPAEAPAAAAPTEREEAECDSEEGCEAPPEEPAARVPAAGRSSPLGLPSSTFRPDYVDVREDRVVLYGSVGPDVREFVYRIRATHRGTFTVPPVFGESMYDRAMQGRGLGGRLTVEGG
ncbi:MAG TPA: alpha-2-macroglobulin [Elusimicrobia bacterium]|nr:alpha-2-macroglobulin [Elusimicrobiota bacterium]